MSSTKSGAPRGPAQELYMKKLQAASLLDDAGAGDSASTFSFSLASVVAISATAFLAGALWGRR